MGPLIGGVITTTITWRAAFIFQALVIVVILVMARRLVDPWRPIRRARSTSWEQSSPLPGW